MSISPSETDFIIKGIDADMRLDGRGRLDYRPIYIETGLLPHASGSARVQLGDGIDVVVGIKAETHQINPTSDNQDSGLIFVDVECSPSSSQSFEGRGADSLNAELAQILERILSGPQGGLDLQKLCIIPGKACWCIYIDALVLGMGGNLVDALSYATHAALAETKLPATVIEDVGQGNMEFELDADDSKSMNLPGYENVPVIVTLSKYNGRALCRCSYLRRSEQGW
ncbi:hypothetical protein DSO57_1031899 [Entomophthora muscae]|uniref:Uncharacterized protein n=1 Tax=Entomophthora muscae TaxID=34485 RepID=A0ACC2SPQ6_9FUNG|nr:hypothetical protein DSO57_1031899 [Entomophthora muscae]